MTVSDFGKNDPVHLIEQHLGFAQKQWRRSENALCWKRFFTRTCIVAAVTIGAVACEIGAARTLAISWVGAAFWTTAGGVFFGLGIGVHIFLTRRHADLRELAERLDLTVRDHNAIATALDLIRGEKRNGFTQLAIEDGIKAAEKHRMRHPMFSQQAVRLTPHIVALSISVIIMGLAYWLPTGRHDYAGRTAVADAVLPPTDHLDVLRQPPTREAKIDGAMMLAHEHSAPTSPSGAGENQRLSSFKAPGEYGVPGSSQSSETNGKMTLSESTQSPSNPSRPQSAQSTPPPHLNAGQTFSSASSSSSAAAGQALSRSPLDGAAASDSSTTSAQSSSSDDADGGLNQAAGTVPPDAARPDRRDNQPAAGKSLKFGQGAGKSDQSGESVGGNGQGSGQNPPKKSHSVAPLMLATPVPDFVPSRKLPGPVERADLQVPPRPTPQTSSADAQVVERAEPEVPVDAYTIPPSSRSEAERYFEQFHQDQLSITGDTK